jgi:predicted pyridoxine 5'-phosphate oxidase superfamily flavin-nucleotide-binding protein
LDREWRREDQSATVIGRAIRSARRTEAIGRMCTEGVALTPAIEALMQQYADELLRMPELVVLAHARAAGDTARGT